MHHLYIQLHSDTLALRKEREALVGWCRANGITRYDWIEDSLTGKRVSSRRIRLLLAGIGKCDTIVTSTLSRLGRSLPMLAMVMSSLRDKAASIITLDGRTMTPGPEFDDFVDNLSEIVSIEKEIKVSRTNEVLKVKREEGLVLGRPSGSRKNPEKNVLYGKTDELLRLRAQGLTQKEIGDRLGVSRGTISNYLKGRGVA